MKRIISLIFGIGLLGCNNSADHPKGQEVQVVRLGTESRISFIGDPTVGIVSLPLKNIDSLKLIEKPTKYPDFQLELYKGKIATRLMKVGDFPFKAKLYSNGHSYLLIDTIKIRPPSSVISSRFGEFLIANQENYLSVSSNGQIRDDLKLESDKGSLQLISPGEYLLAPMKEDTIKISSYTMINGAERLIGTKTFIVINGDIKLKDLQ